MPTLVFETPAEAQAPQTKRLVFDDAPQPQEQVLPPAFESQQQPGLIDRAKAYVTGEGKNPEGLGEFNPRISIPGIVKGDIPFGAGIKTAVGMALTSDPKAEAEIIAKNVPGAEITYDTNGNPIVAYPKADGSLGREFVNVPGASPNDFNNFLADSAAFIPASKAVGLVGKGASTGVNIAKRLAAAFGAGAATSATQDKAAQQFGSEQPVDLAKAGITGAFTTGGEAVAPAVGRLIASLRGALGLVTPKGTLTPKGLEFVKKQGVNPDEVTKGLARQYEGLSKEAIATQGSAKQTRANKYGIPLTKGQASGDFKQQATEEAILNNSRGDKAGQILRDFQDTQQKKINESADLVLQREIATQAPINSSTDAFNTIKQGVDTNAAALDDLIQDAYTTASGKKASLSAESVSDLVNRVGTALKGSIQDPKLAPATNKAFRELQSLTKPPKEGVRVKSLSIQGLEEKRRILNQYIEAAANPADKRNATIIKRQFDKWLDDAFDNALFSGDPDALKSLKEARSLRADYGAKFQQRDSKDVAGRMMEKIMQDDATPEQVANAIFGRAKLGGKLDSVQVVKRLGEALGTGSAEFNAIQQAGFLHMLQSAKKGDNISPVILAKEIENALEKAPSLMDALYSKQQQNVLREYAAALRDTRPALKQPSKTAYGVSRELQSGFNRLMQVFGIATGNPGAVIGGAILQKAPGATGARAARKAAAGVPIPMPRSIIPPVAAGAAAQSLEEN